MKVTLIEFTGRTAMRYYGTMLTNALVERPDIGAVELLVPENFERPALLNSEVKVSSFRFPNDLKSALAQGFSPVFLKQLGDQVSESNPDVVHFMSEIRTPTTVVYVISRSHPTVLTVHEPDAYVPKLLRRILLNPIQNTNTRIASSLVDSVFVHGADSKRKLGQKGVSLDKIGQYPHGSLAPFYSQHPAEGCSGDGETVLFFGRIYPGKGIKYFLEAAAQLQRERPATTFLLAGSGDLSNHQRTVEHLDNLVIRNEFIGEREAADLFRRASVVVLPYTHGSQSGIIGIAAEFETPVVSTDVGNFSEMIRDGETGVIVPPEDSRALADSIISLLEDDHARQNMGRASKRYFETTHSWQAAAETIHSTYKNLL